LVVEQRQIAVALHPLRVHISDDGLRGGPHDQRLGQLLLAGARDPGDLRREALDVLRLAFEEAGRNEEWEVGVDVAGRLDAVVELALHVLPERVAVGADHHAAAHRRLVGELGLVDEIEVPAGKVVAVGELLDELLLCRLALRAVGLGVGFACTLRCGFHLRLPILPRAVPLCLRCRVPGVLGVGHVCAPTPCCPLEIHMLDTCAAHVIRASMPSLRFQKKCPPTSPPSQDSQGRAVYPRYHLASRAYLARLCLARTSGVRRGVPW